MTDLNDEALTQLEKHQETLRFHEFVRLIEEHHREDGPGVDRETLEAYAEAVYFDVDLSGIDDRLTASESWEPGESLYELPNGRISNYPQDWHEAMSGTDDIRTVLETIQTEVTEPEGKMQEAVTEERGVPEDKVLRVAETVAGIDRESAREKLKRLRKNDEIEEFASQNRNPTIRLS